MPDEPTALGLLALVLLQDARRAARFGLGGLPVLLSAQDRTSWDASLIKEGVELVGAACAGHRRCPNPYVVQAAIAACHDLAPSYAETNWDAVISWYDVLLSVQDTPVVRLNRAAAVAERDGPVRGFGAGGRVAGAGRSTRGGTRRGQSCCTGSATAGRRAARTGRLSTWA